MKFHVIQHVSFETAGLLADLILRRGHLLTTTAVFDGELLPVVEDFDVLIIMGGPMSIHDEFEYPWLAAEKKLIGASIREGKKVLGICLGAQLIAAVCGARVYPNAQKEIGFWPVRWVKDGLSGAPGVKDGSDHLVFHWHGETFDLPVGAIRLASTDVCVNQAFSLGENVLGIQFHPEVTEGIIREMVEHEGWELEEGADAPYVQGAEWILAAAREILAAEEKTGAVGFDGRGVEGRELGDFGHGGIRWLGEWLGL